ncbi:TPA: TolC family protein [Burkholderia cenocepacia]|uniref:TolC family protein n=1 Tax=unclassified Burkholderia TaxID=2613784 RepID=UPI00158CA729|nr:MULTISPECIES: TolC family protein [unclassified Burkholderia]HEF5874880.1 TolC family protein [Burkholderia cenocepacia]
MKRIFLLAALLWVTAADAETLDVFRTGDDVPASPSAPMVRDASCRPTPDDRPLELDDAILEAICAHPSARRAWADARAQAAAVGIAEAAYLPTLNATAGIQRNTLSTTYDYSAIGLGSQSQSQNSSSKYGMLNLSWVLFDFGKRSAGLRQARALLAAANAEHGGALQTVFFDAAQAYYAMHSAQASVDAAKQAERIARDSLAAASAKHAAGAGTLSDQLQAQTLYSRAVLDRVGAEGDLRAATGVLAVAMGREANMPVRIAAEKPVPNDAAITQGVDQLITEAAARNPRLLAARAKLDAARANVDAARAQRRPTVSLLGSYTRNNPSYQQQPESFPITHSHGSTIGVQVTIPLFEGFASGYRVEQAQAQADAQEAALRDTELQVSLDVWKCYQSLLADTSNLQTSSALLSDAQRSLEIARGRYKEGVGSFTELLNAQTAFVDAQKQRVLAVSKWHTERLKLAASLGKLGIWAEQ